MSGSPYICNRIKRIGRVHRDAVEPRAILPIFGALDGAVKVHSDLAGVHHNQDLGDHTWRELLCDRAEVVSAGGGPAAGAAVAVNDVESPGVGVEPYLLIEARVG